MFRFPDTNTHKQTDINPIMLPNIENPYKIQNCVVYPVRNDIFVLIRPKTFAMCVYAVCSLD